MKILFPGTFDPFTVGHADLVRRALKIADSVVIAVGVNVSKKCMWSAPDRVDAIRRYYSDEPRVTVVSYSGLTFEQMRQTGCDVMLRGVRSVADYEVERSLADANRTVGGAETLLMVSDSQYQHISSSLVRELVSFGHPVGGMMIDTFAVPEKEMMR